MQIADRGIDRCGEIDLGIGGICGIAGTIVTQLNNLGAHASPHESLRGTMQPSR